MLLSQTFALVLVGFTCNVVAAPLVEREASINAQWRSAEVYARDAALNANPIPVALVVLPRDPALNAIPTKASSVYYGKRAPTPPPAVKREPALNAVSGGYKQVINPNVEERALNAVQGYKQVIAEGVEKRDPLPALNAGYNQNINNEDIAKRDPDPALNAGYTQLAKPGKRDADAAINANSYGESIAAKKEKRAINANSYGESIAAKGKRNADPALNAGSYSQVAKPGNRRALNAGYNQYVEPEQ